MQCVLTLDAFFELGNEYNISRHAATVYSAYSLSTALCYLVLKTTNFYIKTVTKLLQCVQTGTNYSLQEMGEWLVLLHVHVHRLLTSFSLALHLLVYKIV